jgi:hypothetical protein
MRSFRADSSLPFDISCNFVVYYFPSSSGLLDCACLETQCLSDIIQRELRRKSSAHFAARRSYRIISARATSYSNLDCYIRRSSTSHIEPLVLGYHTFASLLFFDLHIQFTYHHLDHTPAPLFDRQDISRRSSQRIH